MNRKIQEAQIFNVYVGPYHRTRCTELCMWSQEYFLCMYNHTSASCVLSSCCRISKVVQAAFLRLSLQDPHILSSTCDTSSNATDSVTFQCRSKIPSEEAQRLIALLDQTQVTEQKRIHETRRCQNEAEAEHLIQYVHQFRS